ncbi:GNAT family N-acetyltransferase [Alicyclobacillus sp. SO9]|uniref:GNAT family N-acetyltransferase n=1 Tax=Alicyclobacillus sp. SO9 TaxID=2665646 RepID=UPI0018E7160D|nr:GNAT family N-acetyltransferase [Alicyclobacillus sp. SO9]QQE81262.1 GNAT family N-acetyltransferase [Alicyclobacillus sp. SO9]
MRIEKNEFVVRDLSYVIRSAEEKDAPALSALRLQVDGETENLDRESGEDFMDAQRFKKVIQTDTDKSRNLFLVASTRERLIGFSRCEGNYLQRFAHKVEFGVAVLRPFWGYGIGTNLLNRCVAWADTNGIRKMTLTVLETNIRAIALYEHAGFVREGTLINDKLLSDGDYHNTVVMGRWDTQRMIGAKR